MTTYLTEYISYEPDASMMAGMDLYFELAEKHGLIGKRRPIEFSKAWTPQLFVKGLFIDLSSLRFVVENDQCVMDAQVDNLLTA